MHRENVASKRSVRCRGPGLGRRQDLLPSSAAHADASRVSNEQSPGYNFGAIHLNPPSCERGLWTLSSARFRWNITHASASLQRQRARFLERLPCFKRASQGDGLEDPFGTALEEQLSFRSTGWNFNDASIRSLGAKSPSFKPAGFPRLAVASGHKETSIQSKLV